MAFDAELQTITSSTFAPVQTSEAAPADPAAEMAVLDPQRLLAFLYVAPRPCAALDVLIGA